MSVDDEKVAEVVEAFQGAALGATPWLVALERLAHATGSKCGELIGLGADAAVPFNWLSGLDSDAAAEFIVAGGGDIRVNSRVRTGLRAGELTVLDEGAFTTAEDCRRYPDYSAWISRHDVPYVCLSPLLKQDGLVVGLCVARSEREGHISAEQKRIYTALAPHVRGAVRTQMAIESQGLALLNNLMEAMSAAAFVCDGAGRVRAMSARAETLVADGSVLRLTRGRLAPRREADAPPLSEALALAASIGEGELLPPPRAVVLRDRLGERPLLLEISTIPGDQRRFGAAVLVAARTARRDEAEKAELGRILFGFSPTEALVAAKLVCGDGPQAVAEAIGISVGTVRTHVRNIYAKAAVSTQLELAAALSL